ncbi:hypothetical protein QYE76_011452 [Lolium multiflorum]|uniref:Uncharacterized protein n=1 Tax=Lolium multiflorum TaxID=4521 RepID=A0AAD8TZ80_LOLMU|nr:hypothetical protein QYE76_011452 [Lolium multiflorum]
MSRARGSWCLPARIAPPQILGRWRVVPSLLPTPAFPGPALLLAPPLSLAVPRTQLSDCKKEKIVTTFDGESYDFNFSKFAKAPYKTELPNEDFIVEQLASIAIAPNNALQQYMEDHESEYDHEKMVIFDIKLMVGFGCDTIPILKVPPQYPKWMEPYVQTETYDLENGGSLVFERDLYLVSEKLERPPPQFHGVRIHTPAGEQQWMITADLKGSSEPPISERILFSFKAYSWMDGLAHALQEGLARVCGQNIAALRGSRFAHFARHDTMGEPMALSSHPVLKIHVQHLDFMLHETRKDLELTRVHSHRAQMALAHHADAIRLLAKDRRSLRLQRAKNVATITRLREKIRTLEMTVRTQQDQIQEMEEAGEDIQGGDDFLSDDNDFEDDEFTDEEDYEFLEAAEDGIIPIDVDEDPEE